MRVAKSATKLALQLKREEPTRNNRRQLTLTRRNCASTTTLLTAFALLKTHNSDSKSPSTIELTIPSYSTMSSFIV
jgi:hypothetical protein